MSESKKTKQVMSLTPETDEVAKRLGFQIEHVTGEHRVRAYYRYRTERGQEKRNANGERLVVEVIHCIDPGDSDSIPALWKKHRCTSKRLSAYWYLSTYVYNTNEECHVRYNPQEALGSYGQPPTIDFAWMFPATVESFEKLLSETLRRFMACQC